MTKKTTTRPRKTKAAAKKSAPKKEKAAESKFSDIDIEKIINAVAGDIIKTTNLMQAFELVKEKAFQWANDHVKNTMPEEEKTDILQKIEEFEAEQEARNQAEQNPESGATISS
jgi:hypothetical protein